MQLLRNIFFRHTGVYIFQNFHIFPPPFLKNHFFSPRLSEIFIQVIFQCLTFIFPLGHFPGLMGKKMADSKFFPPHFMLFHSFFPLSFLYFPPWSFQRLDGEKNGRFQIFPPYFPLFHPFFPICFLHFSPLAIPRVDGGKKWQNPNFFPLI